MAWICKEVAEQLSWAQSANLGSGVSSVTSASHWMSLSFLIWKVGRNIVPLRSNNFCIPQAWPIVGSE